MHDPRAQQLTGGGNVSTTPLLRRPRVSVCMATHNGEKFVEEQLASILQQLDAGDEIVIVDDCSTDKSRSAVEEIGDPRIKLIASPRRNGHVASFAEAISLSRGDVVFLSDQDDIWTQGRVEEMMKVLAWSRVDVVAAGFRCFPDQKGPSELGPYVGPTAKSRWSSLFGLASGSEALFGSAMVFRGDLRDRLLPFPKFVEAHDHWIAVVGIANGGIGTLREVVTWRRIHSRNLTPLGRRAVSAVVRTRLVLLGMLAVAIWRRVERRCRSRNLSLRSSRVAQAHARG